MPAPPGCGGGEGWRAGMRQCKAGLGGICAGTALRCRPGLCPALLLPTSPPKPAALCTPAAQAPCGVSDCCACHVRTLSPCCQPRGDTGPPPLLLHGAAQPAHMGGRGGGATSLPYNRWGWATRSPWGGSPGTLHWGQSLSMLTWLEAKRAKSPEATDPWKEKRAERGWGGAEAPVRGQGRGWGAATLAHLRPTQLQHPAVGFPCRPPHSLLPVQSREDRIQP